MRELKYFKGLKKEATISKRYRELAKKYHPDIATNDADRAAFEAIMKDINEEHKEVLILLKYEALEQPKSEPKSEQKTELKTDKVVKNVASIFNLTKEQKRYFAEQGRNMLLTLYDNIVDNNFRR